jgi:hypothetical protein
MPAKFQAPNREPSAKPFMQRYLRFDLILINANRHHVRQIVLVRLKTSKYQLGYILRLELKPADLLPGGLLFAPRRAFFGYSQRGLRVSQVPRHSRMSDGLARQTRHVETDRCNFVKAACATPNRILRPDLIVINASPGEVGHIVMVTLNTALLLRLI